MIKIWQIICKLSEVRSELYSYFPICGRQFWIWVLFSEEKMSTVLRIRNGSCTCIICMNRQIYNYVNLHKHQVYVPFNAAFNDFVIPVCDLFSILQWSRYKHTYLVDLNLSCNTFDTYFDKIIPTFVLFVWKCLLYNFSEEDQPVSATSCLDRELIELHRKVEIWLHLKMWCPSRFQSYACLLFGSTYCLVHITTNVLLLGVECWFR